MHKMMDKVQAAALDMVMDYVLKDPAHNLSKLAEWADTFDQKGTHASQINAVRTVAADPENNWNRFVVNLCNEVDHLLGPAHHLHSVFCVRKIRKLVGGSPYLFGP